MKGGILIDSEEEFRVSFGYQCDNGSTNNECCEMSDGCEIKIRRNTGSFSCLSGAALSANCTWANTNICNGLFGSEILPNWDSPKSFRKVSSSPSLSKLDVFASLQTSMSNLSCSPSTQAYLQSSDFFSWKSPGTEGFLSSMEVQVAGGAAGEDRVQAVCSEEDGWLYCGIYDGFNGRDAADFLACTLYEIIVSYLKADGTVQYRIRDDSSDERSRQGVVKCLRDALFHAESNFLCMVEQEMEERPDLVSVGCCVLVVVLLGRDMYTLNVGDSRAVLASFCENGHEILRVIQLSDIHSIDNEAERNRLLDEHPSDSRTIVHGRVKGKLKVTRAFGVGYLKKKNLNDALMGILRVQNLVDPPYVSLQPSLNVHRISKTDRFVIIGSDGLFDFFTNDEAVQLVNSYILITPFGDPAKFLLQHLLAKAALSAGFSMEELMSVPAGRRRKYHDDITIIVIILGSNQRTSKASTCL